MSITVKSSRTTELPLPNLIKIFQIIKKLWSAEDFGQEICSGEITRKTKQELSFWHATLLLDLIYVPIKLFQSVWELWPAKDFSFRGDKYIMKKVRVVLLQVTCLLVLLFIPIKILSKWLHEYQSYDAHKDASKNRQTPCWLLYPQNLSVEG